MPNGAIVYSSISLPDRIYYVHKYTSELVKKFAKKDEQQNLPCETLLLPLICPWSLLTIQQCNSKQHL